MQCYLITYIFRRALFKPPCSTRYNIPSMSHSHARNHYSSCPPALTLLPICINKRWLTQTSAPYPDALYTPQPFMRWFRQSMKDYHLLLTHATFTKLC